MSRAQLYCRQPCQRLLIIGIRSAQPPSVILPSRMSMVRSPRSFVVAVRQLRREHKVDWVCVQGRLASMPSRLLLAKPLGLDEAPVKEMCVGLSPVAVLLAEGVYVAVDEKKVFRVCAKARSSSDKHMALYGLATQLCCSRRPPSSTRPATSS